MFPVGELEPESFFPGTVEEETTLFVKILSSSSDKSADEVDDGDKVGKWIMSCKNAGNNGGGAGVRTSCPS